MELMSKPFDNVNITLVTLVDKAVSVSEYLSVECRKLFERQPLSRTDVFAPCSRLDLSQDLSHLCCTPKEKDTGSS